MPTSKIKRLWPTDEQGGIIFQNDDRFDSFGWSDKKRRAALKRDEDICEDTAAVWLKEGIEVSASRYSPYLISSVRLPFTPQQWVDILDKEGEYLGACCATISEVRDYMFGAAREGGWIDVKELAAAVELIESHNGSHEDDPEIDPLGTDDPIHMMITVWKMVQDHAYVDEFVKPLDHTDPENAAEIVHKSCGEIRWGGFFCGGTGDKKQDEFACKAFRVKTLYKLLPALHTLYHKARKLAPNKLNGYALCVGDVVIIEGRAGGWEVLPTKKEAERRCAYYKKNVSDETIKEKLCVRKVCCSVDKGLEFV